MQLLIAIFLFAMFTLPPSGASAGETTAGTFWGGIEIGGGSIRRTADGTHSDSTFYLNFKGGYAISERLLLAVELGGHTLEAGDLWDPSEGAGVSQVFLVTQYYLQPMRSGWYVKGGAGYVSYWDHSPGALEDKGWGAKVALGHDWGTEGFGRVGPLISLDYGKAGDLDHRAIAVALSWSFP